MKIAIYTDTGACNFCQAPTRWGGAPHAPDCAYWQALTDITDCGVEAVGQAAAMLANARTAITEAEFGLGQCEHPNPHNFGVTP